MVDKILNFDPEGLMKLHFFKDGLEYPIVIAVYSEKEEELLSYLEEMFPTFGFTTMDIIEWCNENKLEYVVLDIYKFSSDGQK